MRTVNIDLSQDITESREKIYVGYTGEHNATELVVKIPQEIPVIFHSLCLVSSNWLRRKKMYDKTITGRDIRDIADNNRELLIIKVEVHISDSFHKPVNMANIPI